MRRRTMAILALLCGLLLAAGCGAKTGTPGQRDPELSGLAGRMAAVQEDDLVQINARADVDAASLAEALNGAAAHTATQAPAGNTYYTLEAFLTGGDSSDDEHFTLSAGLEEDLVEVQYAGPVDPISRQRVKEQLLVEDEALYRLVRESCRTPEHIDQVDYTRYQEVLSRRAEDTVAASGDWGEGRGLLTGFDITEFYRKETFVDGRNTYAVYVWAPAFTLEDPDRFPWAGGTYLDAEARLCGFEQYTFFVVCDPAAPSQRYRFLPWDIYAAEDGRENALRQIRLAFAPAISVTWGEETLPEEAEVFTVPGSEPESWILFSAESAVRDFAVLALTYDDTDDAGWPRFTWEELYRLEELTAERPLALGVEFYGSLPNCGVSYTDGTGMTVRYAVVLSGMDGSLLLEEIAG